MSLPGDDISATPESDTSRRDFLRLAAVLAGGVATQALPGLSGEASAAVSKGAYGAANFLLELDGQYADNLKSVEGGYPRGELVEMAQGGAIQVRKSIAGVRYSDIAFQIDAPMPASLQGWVGDFMAMNPKRKNGSLVVADVNYQEKSRLDFSNALISEFTIPACDAADRARGYFSFKVAPEVTRPVLGKGGAVKGGGLAKGQKGWVTSNFQLKIAGLDQACSKVVKIDAMTIKQKFAEYSAGGGARVTQQEPGKIEFPNLVIYLPEHEAEPFYQWFEDFVVKGNNGDNKERSGTLDLLSMDLRTVLMRLNFSQIGIFGFTPEKRDAAADTPARVKVEMYVEQISLDGKGGGDQQKRGQDQPASGGVTREVGRMLEGLRLK